MEVFDKLFGPLIILFAISFLFFFLFMVSFIKNDQLGKWQNVTECFEDRLFTTVCVVFLSSAIIVFGGGFIFKQLTKNELITYLKAFDSTKDQVIINQNAPSNPKAFIDQMLQLSTIENNRPSGKEIQVTVIIGKERIDLVLNGALDDSTVYLVYLPKYKTFRENTLGQIRTSSLQLTPRIPSSQPVNTLKKN